MTLFHSACTVRLRVVVATALFAASFSAVPAQTSPKPGTVISGPDRSAAYYHYGL